MSFTPQPESYSSVRSPAASEFSSRSFLSLVSMETASVDKPPLSGCLLLRFGLGTSCCPVLQCSAPTLPLKYWHWRSVVFWGRRTESSWPSLHVQELPLPTKRWPSPASPVPVPSWGSNLHVSYHTMPRMGQKFFPSIMESLPSFPNIAALVASLYGVIGKPWYSFLRIIYYGLLISLPFSLAPLQRVCHPVSRVTVLSL